MTLIPLSQRSHHPSMLCTVHFVPSLCVVYVDPRSIIKAPMCGHLSLWDPDHVTTGTRGSAHLSQWCSAGTVELGIIGLDKYHHRIGVYHWGEKLQRNVMSRWNVEQFIKCTSRSGWMLKCAWWNEARVPLLTGSLWIHLVNLTDQSAPRISRPGPMRGDAVSG